MSSLLLYSLLLMAVMAAVLAIVPPVAIRRWWAVAVAIAAVAGAVVVLWWPAPRERTARGKRLIDVAMPRFQFLEHHETRVCASADKIAAGIRQVEPREVQWLALLSAVRGLPEAAEDQPILETAVEASFVMLADTPEELVLGTAGEFWRGVNQLDGLAATRGNPAAFAAFAAMGQPKAAMNFAIGPAPFGCKLVTTETRIHAGDARMRARFAAYWRAIQPGSALLRRTWLDAIRRRAEGTK